MRQSGPVRVLWVSAEPPDRSLGGGNIRQAHLLEALAHRHETHLLVTGRLGDDRVRAALAGVREVAEAPPPAVGSTWRRRLLDLELAGPSGPPERYEAGPARARLAVDLSDAGFDVVVVQHAGLAPLLRGRRHAAWVCELHNIGSSTLTELAAIAPGGRQRWIRHRQADRARRFERWIARSYDALVTVSRPDAQTLVARSHVVPNGVDTTAWQRTALPQEPRVVFTATLNYLPNVDGIVWFCREVWPSVRERVPAATLQIVGRAPVAEVRSLAAVDGVSVHPDVPDVAPYVEAARLAVVPLRAGSGTRVKALEAWAAGRPVVATSTGLAGLEMEPGRHALVADDPAGLASAVVRCLTEDETAVGLADAGHQLAAGRYEWSVLGADYARWIDSVGLRRQQAP
jgi:glycosyltransferase involved in cell wall biosynthesis